MSTHKQKTIETASYQLEPPKTREFRKATDLQNMTHKTHNEKDVLSNIKARELRKLQHVLLLCRYNHRTVINNPIRATLWSGHSTPGKISRSRD